VLFPNESGTTIDNDTASGAMAGELYGRPPCVKFRVKKRSSEDGFDECSGLLEIRSESRLAPSCADLFVLTMEVLYQLS
jgi:hypothetical protein